MKEIIAHIKEKQKEYNTESAAYRVLRELEVTLPSLFAEDKKAPVDETAENILKTAIGETRYNLSGSITNGQILWAMQEYASQERNRAIQQCEEFIRDWYENERALEGKDFYTELSKLKK